MPCGAWPRGIASRHRHRCCPRPLSSPPAHPAILRTQLQLALLPACSTAPGLEPEIPRPRALPQGQTAGSLKDQRAGEKEGQIWDPQRRAEKRTTHDTETTPRARRPGARSASKQALTPHSGQERQMGEKTNRGSGKGHQVDWEVGGATDSH